MAVNLGRFGRLEFGDWAYGLMSAAISGGANTVVTSVGLNLADPKDFNTENPHFLKIVSVVFICSAVFNGLNFMRTNPLPKMKQIVTTVETTQLHPDMSEKVVTKVEETKVVPVAEKTDNPKP